MNTQKIKKSLTVIWLALALSFGTGLIGVQLGLDNLAGPSATLACGGAHGGGC